ncbi:hypothetical protein G6F31_016622 [Rhizopus arrhizus]|nr:hypothetical protein G6F31_016622 [Rhizopus arrhizus]
MYCSEDERTPCAGAAQVRLQDAVHDDQRDHQQRAHQPEVLALGQDVAADGRLGNLDAQGAFGHEGHLVGQDLDDGAERQRHHGQVGPRDPQRRQRQHRAKRRRDQDRGGQYHPDGHLQMEEQHARDIRADAEQPGMAERHLAGVTHHDIEPEQQDRIDHDRFDQVQVIRVGHAQRHGGQAGHGHDG